MGRSASWLPFGGTVVVSLTIGLVIGFGLHAILATGSHSGEFRQHELETLRHEVGAFFYDTMREMFRRTDGLQGDRVSREALAVFNEYRSRLEPRCWLVDVWPVYGIFYGDALFPSGDVFEVGMRETDKGWVLESLNHMGTRYLYRNLSENQPAKAD